MLGMKVISNPYIPSELPALTFDPLRKCDAWASRAYRQEVDAWLLKRFGMQQVAFVFQPRALGLGRDRMLALNPKHAAMLRNLCEKP